VERSAALALLGLGDVFDDAALRRARRLALIANHPDHGGSREKLYAVECAYTVLSTEDADLANGAMRFRVEDVVRLRRGSDRPSFTIEALPVDAYELLLMAAAELGDVADDDPPYRLEVRMNEPPATWVSLELVPDAGASTVSLVVESQVALDIDRVRDAWVDTINALQLP
jgi:hypothetical protein